MARTQAKAKGFKAGERNKRTKYKRDKAVETQKNRGTNPSELAPRMAVPVGTPKATPRTTIFPISLPRIPESLFPIHSHEDLVAKLSRFFLLHSYIYPAAQASANPPQILKATKVG